MRGEHRDGARGFGRWAGLCILAFAFGCSVYDSRLIDGGAAGVPDRPAASTSSADDAESMVFALNEIFLGQTSELAARIGIDLDGTITTGPSDATCRPPTVDGEAVGQSVPDGQKGIDNAIGSLLLPTAETALPCLEDNLALTQGRGIGTIILWVQGWNGQDDDARVSVVMTNSVDGTSEDPSLIGFGVNDAVNLVYLDGGQSVEAPDPAWDGHDAWFLDPVDFDLDAGGQPSLDLPKIRQVDGYVTHGRLVVPLLPETAFKLIAGDGTIPSDGDMTIVVNGGVLMGDVSDDRSRLEHGLFAGRLTLERLSDITPKVGMCAFDADLMETLLGQFADIPALPEDDSAGLECDAFSVGVTFSGTAGEIGGLGAFSRPSLNPCAQTETVIVDSCCPSEWLGGKSRLETCDTPEKVVKAARFDVQSNVTAIPVPAPAAY